MSSESLPAVSLVAVPGRRRQTLDIAREFERRGFAGIYIPSRFGNMAQCAALAFAIERIPFGTAIAPIYARTVEDFAQSAAYLHEVSGGRFRFGIGIAHGPTYQRLAVIPGKPLSDTRAFVEKLKSYEGIGELPPIILATLRKRMVALAAEIGNGMIFANASLSHMPQSLAAVPAAQRNDPDFLSATCCRSAFPMMSARQWRCFGGGSIHYALAAELPRLLEGSGLCRRNGSRRTNDRRQSRRRNPEISE